MTDHTDHTLLSTDDPEIWAEEFCRIFSGKMIAADEMNDTAHGPVTPSTMVGWFASAMVTAINLYERKKLVAKEQQQESFLEGFSEGRTTYRVDVGESITEVVDEPS